MIGCLFQILQIFFADYRCCQLDNSFSRIANPSLELDNPLSRIAIRYLESDKPFFRIAIVKIEGTNWNPR